MTEKPYIPEKRTTIRTISSARILILHMLMQPWIGKGKIAEQDLRDSLKVLTVSRQTRKQISDLIDNYSLCNGLLTWKTKDLPILQSLVQDILGLKDKDFEKIENSETLRKLVESKLKKCTQKEINDICYILASKE